jgi:alpha-tubulin suppressor-like RCC1 family protein
MSLQTFVGAAVSPFLLSDLGIPTRFAPRRGPQGSKKETPLTLSSGRNRLVWFVVALFVVLLGPGDTEAACGGSSVLATDKPDYGPTETVAISGIGFNCGELLSVLVTAPDGSTRSGDGTGTAGPDSVVTDDNGSFALRYHLSGALADGSSYEGQLGIYRVELRDGSGTVLVETRFSDAGGTLSCALTTGGSVKCWGHNGSGQLGNGSYTDSAIPVDVAGLTSGVVQITVGFQHACALTSTGGVKCWGLNAEGQLGNGTFTTSPPYGIATPVDVIGLTSDVAQVAAGFYHTCAMTTGGGAKCWGRNDTGQMGNGTFTTSAPYGIATPVDVSGLTNGVAQISGGGYHTCAVTMGGGVKCWGDNSSGQLGFGTVTIPLPPSVSPQESATPVDVSTLTSGVAQIGAGGAHTCAVTTSGAAKCWGYSFWGQLGYGYGGTSRYISLTPLDVSGLMSGVARITAGGYHTCAVTTVGGAKCWGYTVHGQLGNGVTVVPENGIFFPVDVSTLTSGVAQISAGYFHTCAVTTAGGAKCWGYNGDGALGDGTFMSRATPVDVSGLTSGVAALWDGEPIVDEPIPSIFYEIVSRNSDKCLDVTYASAEAAASVIQWICHGGANQQWRLEPVSDGAFRIIAHHSGQVLDVYGGLVDDVTPIIQYPWHGGDNQLWTVEPASNGYVFIVARHSGKVLDVESGSMDDGARVIQYTIHGGANQQWLFRAVAPAADLITTVSDREP